MRFISWNVNGLRACMNKGFMDTFQSMDADFFCLQETKLQAGQIQLDLPGYHQYWCYAEKKGYSGTAIFTRHKPQSVTYGIGIPELDTEGRVICLEYPEFYLVTCYTPNAQRGLARIEHRLKWEKAFCNYLKDLDTRKPVVICGDLNVAHKEIDLKNPSSNRGNAGFSDEERSAFSSLLDSGFTDTFRHLHPDKTGAYSWWSYMFNARQNNAGWRIDYFLVSDRLKDQIYAADIHPEVMGSDHCPVSLDLDTTCNGGLHIPVPRCAEETETKADGEPPIGSVLKKTVPILLPVLALLLLIPVALHFQKSPSPEPPSSTISQVVADNDRGNTLISDIIDRTGTLEYIVDTPSLFSSSMRQYLVCGEKRWELEGFLPDNAYVSSPINYHLQIIFDPTRRFDANNKPEITVISSDLTATKPASQIIRYYIEDGTIAGCFLSGYASSPFRLQLRISWNGITELSSQRTVIPFADEPLIARTDLLNDYRFEYDLPTTHSTYAPSLWLVQGTERWCILSDDGFYPYVNFAAGAALRIEFPRTAQFTWELKPLVGAELIPDDPTPSVYEKEDLWTRTFYYLDENDRVAGAFIFAYASTEAVLKITAQHTNSAVQKTVLLTEDLSQLPSNTLARLLVDSHELRFYIDQGGDYLPTLLKESPALRELVSRSDCVDAMINANSTTSIGSNFDALLLQDYFRSKMTDLQKELFESQLERNSIYRGFYYDILDNEHLISGSILQPAPPVSP